MKKSWEVRKLVDVCPLITCGVAKRPQYVEDGIPFLSAKNVKNGIVIFDDHKYISEETHKELTKNNKPLKGDILYTRVGSYGEAAVIEEEIEFSVFVSLTLIKVDTNILNQYYLKYYLNSDAVKILAKNSISGSGVGNLNVGTVRKFQIPIPPLPEQKSIVSILDRAFEAIDKAKANAEQNLNNAKELFESYLQGVFENKGDDWEEHKLDEVCSITSKLIDPKETKYQDLMHIGAGNIEAEKGTLIDLKTAKEENLISGKFLFDETMVLYSKIRPYLMKIVKCEFVGLCSADIYPLVPIKDKITQSFLYYLLYSNNFTEYAIMGSQRAGMPKVNRKHLFDYSFFCPPIREQIIIVQNLDSLLAESKKLESIYQQKIDDLEELKKSVLQKAFAGELTSTSSVTKTKEIAL